jgi:hypothetical protein
MEKRGKREEEVRGCPRAENRGRERERESRSFRFFIYMNSVESNVTERKSSEHEKRDSERKRAEERGREREEEIRGYPST